MVDSAVALYCVLCCENWVAILIHVKTTMQVVVMNNIPISLYLSQPQMPLSLVSIVNRLTSRSSTKVRSISDTTCQRDWAPCRGRNGPRQWHESLGPVRWWYDATRRNRYWSLEKRGSEMTKVQPTLGRKAVAAPAAVRHQPQAINAWTGFASLLDGRLSRVVIGASILMNNIDDGVQRWRHHTHRFAPPTQQEMNEFDRVERN